MHAQWRDISILSAPNPGMGGFVWRTLAWVANTVMMQEFDIVQAFTYLT